MSTPRIPVEQVVRLWLHRQGLATPRASAELTPGALTEHLERTGGLQVDTISVLDRAHYLTLWSRFGNYDREQVDGWIYDDRFAYEYWGHEASILPISHLPLGLRRMRGFPPKKWSGKAWWSVYSTSTASKRRVLKRLREQGPLESADFEAHPDEFGPEGPPGGGMPLPKEDKRSLKLLWHDGRVAVARRRHFRCVYDLAERVYPEASPATPAEYEDSWLFAGLAGNGIAGERHLANYFTAPDLHAPDRRRVIARNLRHGRIVEVRVDGQRGAFYALPEQLDSLDTLPEPRGTTLICPFDSLLWQRRRAEDLLGFRYRIEIYVPPKKREFGYYVLPILHDGRLVGRLDPKVHRDRGTLEVKAVYLEAGFRRDRRFEGELAAALDSLREHVGAERLELPEGWRRLG
ncbi:MAG TPA: crosslink repair DNA glycosylase YcaQ family protein [Thermoanaerobaculia bacterium]